MASSQPLRKLRILCLHGYMQVRRLLLWLWLPSRLTMPNRQNARIFNSKTGALRKSLKRVAELGKGAVKRGCLSARLSGLLQCMLMLPSK